MIFSLVEEPGPASKRTRTSPKPAEGTCVFCAQTKKGSSKSKHKFSGDINEILAKFVHFDNVVDNICACKENNKDILYHASCYREYQRRSIMDIQTADISQPPSREFSPKRSDQTLPPADDMVTQQLIQVALLMKQEVKDLGNKIRSQNCLISPSDIPKNLTTFLSLLLGKESNSPAVSSLAQDVIYASGYKTTKHVFLSSTVRHWTRSKKLVSLLNAMGHCCSYSDTLRMETNHANEILGSFRTNKVHVPENIDRDQFAYFAADNIDFEECLPDGKGTTHGINMIAYQNASASRQTHQTPNNTLPPKHKTRSLQLTSPEIYGHINERFVYPAKGNHSPKAMSHRIAELVHTRKLATSSVENMAWAILRQSGLDKGIAIPTWGAYHSRLSEYNVPSLPTTLAYLPMLNEPATDQTSVNKCLTILETTAKQLNQATTVIFMDQAMYALTKKIVWANPDKHPSTVIMMGGFHISMNFLSAIGKMFCRSGWADILEDSEVFSRRVVDNLVGGKPYSRCLDAHKAMYEALMFQKVDSFRDWLKDKGLAFTESIPIWIDQLCANLYSTSKADLAANPLVTDHQFQDFDAQMRAKSAVYAWWSEYQRLVDIALSQIKAERTGDFALYIESLESMLPVFFATDKPNYSRWLTVHVAEMKSLPDTNPQLYEEFCKGNFVVNRSGASFASVSPDMALEQSLNRDVKCDGGLVGITTNANARNRWYLTSHMRANMTAELCNMAKLNHSSTPAQHTDNAYDQKKSTEWPEKIYQFMKRNSFNPFSDRDCPVIERLTTGERLDISQNQKVLAAADTGKESYEAFLIKRLVTQEISMHEPIHRLNIPFSTKPTKGKTKSKEATAHDQTATFARLAVMAVHRPAEVQELMSREFEEFPSVISNADGTLRKGDKSQLARALKNLLPNEEQRKPIEESAVTEHTAVCIDGMSILHKLVPKDIGTYKDLSQIVWKKVLEIKRRFNANRADMVFDSYSEAASVKDHERNRRNKGAVPMIGIGGSVKIPATTANWQKFLGNGENKRRLIAYFKQDWQTAHYVETLKANEKIVFSSAGLDDPAIMVTMSGCVPLETLQNNHEEADTKLILHAKSCANTNNDIVIVCDDTDVLVLLVHFINKWESQRSFWFANGKAQSSVSRVNDIADILDTKCSNLIGLHCISGCDSVSSIFGVSKSKMVKHGLTEGELSQLGEREAIKSTQFIPLLYTLYGCQEFTGSLSELRYKLLAEKGKIGRQLPPTEDVWMWHVKRAHAQAMIWKQADVPHQQLPDLLLHGWLKEGEGLTPQYHSGAVASLNSIVACKCKGNCNTKKCGCKRNNLPCTDACSCPAECTNTD